MRIVIGGVPCGGGNIGDEAILASVIRIFQKNVPDSAIVVCTGAPEATAAKFGISSIPLCGFDPEYPAEHLVEKLNDCDIFVWAGETGLSDYPVTCCKLLAAAREKGLKTIVWNVGMNDKFNPALYSIGPSKAKSASIVRNVFSFDLKSHWDKRLTAQTESNSANCTIL